jgi:iron(III) transport system substrate-binding protein
MRIFKVCLFIAFAIFVFPSISLAAAAETEKERHDRLVEGAKKEGSVVLYGSITASESETIRKTFESRYPFLKTTQFRAGSDSLLQKVLTEARAGRHDADVFNIRSFEGNVLVERGLFAKYASPHSKLYRDDFKDREGHWTSFYMNPATIGYNTKLVPRAQAPKDWSDLLDPKWKGLPTC